MAELDVAKEQVAYLKVWLGILVVAEISVFGWLISNLGTATAPLHRIVERTVNMEFIVAIPKSSEGQPHFPARRSVRIRSAWLIGVLFVKPEYNRSTSGRRFNDLAF